MHTGPRAICLLMALVATGNEVATASSPALPTGVPNASVPAGYYRVEAKMVGISSTEAKGIRNGTNPEFVSNEALAKLVGNPKTNAFSFPTVEAPDLHPASIVTGKLNPPQDDFRQRYTVLTLVPEVKGSKSGFSLRFSSLRPVESADRSGRPTFDTLEAVLSAEPRNGYWCFNIPSGAVSYDADGRRKASLADANERQLLFVKISRG